MSVLVTLRDIFDVPVPNCSTSVTLTPNAGTLDDQRLVYAGPIFLLTATVMLVVIGTAYRRLVQAKLEFDDDGNLFADAEVGEYGVTKVARI